MKNTSKILALVLIVMTVLMSLSAITVSAAAGQTWTVAGVKALCGTDWDVSNKNNDMTYDEATDSYVKVYTNVKAGTYEFKCAKDHSWNTSYGNGSANYKLTVAKDGSTVTITLKGTKVTATVEAPSCDHAYEVTAGTVTCLTGGSRTWTCSKCQDSYTENLDALGHSYDATGKCERCDATTEFVRVYVENAAKWAEVYCYTWDTNPYVAWPGAKMNYDEATGLYYYDIPKNFVNVIFSNGNGTQTADLKTPTGTATIYNNSTKSWSAPHSHSFSDPTCTEPAKCECGETQGDALGHSYAEGVCGVCGAADPDYVAPQPPADDLKNYVFDCTTLPGGTDKEAYEGAYDSFFTVGGKATKRWSESKGVYAVEIEKQGKGYFEFTVAGKATIVVYFASTGGSNNSFICLADAEGNMIGTATEVVGTTFITVTYEVEAGTYRITTPAEASRGTRVSKIEVTVDEKVCAHEWADATCAAPKTCKLCGETEGEPTTEHSFVEGICGVCGTADPEYCAHDWADATCVSPKTCKLCGATEGEALGHTWADATCTAPKTCGTCGATDGEALGHTYQFVTTIPTVELPGKTTVSCSVCDYTADFGEVVALGAGQHILDASALAGIASGDLFDGEVRVIDGKFACHLSAKYRTDESAKDFFDGWTSSHRMNFGGESTLTNNGEGEEATRNGGYKNYIQFTTTGETTVTVYWICGGNGRQVGIYDMEGNLLQVSEGVTEKNASYIAEFVLEAGTYLIGTDCTSAEKGGGNYFYQIIVDVKEAEQPGCEHDWADATCEEPKTCKLCGETEGEALGHTYEEGKCACGATDPDYVPDEPVEDPSEDPSEEPTEQPKQNFFARIWAAILAFFQRILAMLKK